MILIAMNDVAIFQLKTINNKIKDDVENQNLL